MGATSLLNVGALALTAAAADVAVVWPACADAGSGAGDSVRARRVTVTPRASAEIAIMFCLDSWSSHDRASDCRRAREGGGVPRQGGVDGGAKVELCSLWPSDAETHDPVVDPSPIEQRAGTCHEHGFGRHRRAGVVNEPLTPVVQHREFVLVLGDVPVNLRFGRSR